MNLIDFHVTKILSEPEQVHDYFLNGDFTDWDAE